MSINAVKVEVDFCTKTHESELKMFKLTNESSLLLGVFRYWHSHTGTHARNHTCTREHTHTHSHKTRYKKLTCPKVLNMSSICGREQKSDLVTATTVVTRKTTCVLFLSVKDYQQRLCRNNSKDDFSHEKYFHQSNKTEFHIMRR